LGAKIIEFAEMSEFEFSQDRSPLLSVFYLILTALIGMYVFGPLIGFILAIPFTSGGIMSLPEKMNQPFSHPDIKLPLYIIQASSTFFGLIVGPALYAYAYEKYSVTKLFTKGSSVLLVLLTAVVVILFMIPNSRIIDWNAHISFPVYLKGFESWARQMEDQAELVTKFLTTFGSLSEFLFAFFVIAILPGIGEELVFRGMLQTRLKQITGNYHFAIWISAALFSALHMQFFGFFPRMVLGALFGYLYAWSGNLIIPVAAHLVNNGFSLILIYLNQLGKIHVDINDSDAAPWSAVVGGSVILAGLLFYMKQLFERKTLSI
jgi:uncharacterized protein